MRFRRRATASDAAPRERHPVSAVVWYIVPTLVAVIAISYFALALAWKINPPAIAVQGTSMEPTLRTGDLVFLERANIHHLRVGDIIAVRVPKLDQSQYGLPASIVHRIVQVKKGTTGPFFVTRGDNNPGPDLFNTQPSMIIGELRGEVPYAGYPFLFLENRNGKIFLGGLFAVAVIYLFISAYEERRAQSQTTVLAMQAVLVEAERLERLAAGATAPVPTPPVSPSPPMVPPVVPPVIPAPTPPVQPAPLSPNAPPAVAPIDAPPASASTPSNELELLAREAATLRRRRKS